MDENWLRNTALMSSSPLDNASSLSLFPQSRFFGHPIGIIEVSLALSKIAPIAPFLSEKRVCGNDLRNSSEYAKKRRLNIGGSWRCILHSLSNIRLLGQHHTQLRR
jgi:hypothetical protein